MDSAVTVAIVTLLGTLFAGVLGVWGQRVVARSQERTKREESRGPEWESFLTQVNEANERQQAWLEKTVEGQNEQISDLKRTVRRLEDNLSDVEGKYSQSLVVIRNFRRVHPDTIVYIPAVIQADL